MSYLIIHKTHTQKKDRLNYAIKEFETDKEACFYAGILHGINGEHYIIVESLTNDICFVC